MLHFDCDDDAERSRREVEAEAVAYIVSRHFGLDADNAAFYRRSRPSASGLDPEAVHLAAWDGDALETVRDRLDRISQTATQLIDSLEE